MKISNNPKYLVNRDVIGLKIYVKSKINKNMKDFSYAGIVIDETYNTILASKEINPKNYYKNYKMYIKKHHIFRFELCDENNITIIEVNGDKLVNRPENRLKKIKKKRWSKV
ncbi:MAG: ribonuclease P protein subunit [Promethearchaeota archaeon]